MFDGLLIGVLLHQFACWLGDSRKQEQLWVKVLVVSSSINILLQTEYVVLLGTGFLCSFGIVSLAFDG